MKKFLLFAILTFMLPLATHAQSDNRILSFDTMYAVNGAFVDDNSVRGEHGDDLPWDIRSAEGYLTRGGELFIDVRGLVFSYDRSVPRRLRGINDERNFRAMVSCLTGGRFGVGVANVQTRSFRASFTGNSTIVTRVRLPRPCVAPVVFIMTGDGDEWLSVTGAGRD